MDKIKTAAYCRVSTNSDTQDGSFEVQCAYYENLIKSDPTMEFVGVYGDHGKSGRAMKGRKELNRLIKDCEDGKIQLVLTKSISRFARNMLECVETIRHLKECGVTVRFEKEGLDTETMGGELMLGILATIAQEESNSISENINWSRRKHIEKGQPWEKARYGYVSVGKEHIWQVVPRETAIVHRAFCMAALCRSTREIAAEMTSMEALSGSGRIWNKVPVCGR
jgi:DNA invertase Pin-like site-specific DNA recombinase